MPIRSIMPFLVLVAGVLAVSLASLFIRYAQRLGIPPTTIAAGRLGFAALVLLPLALTQARAAIRGLRWREIWLGLVAGTFLALHFLSWITSLEYTSVASSVALVSTNPLWVAIASVVFFRERLGTATIAGVALTICGSALIALSDSSSPAAANILFGDALALLGAITVSVYFLIGRELRRTLTTLPYVWLVYSSAAAILAVVAVGSEYSHGGTLTSLVALPTQGWLLLLGLAIGPQLLGHTSFNWALRYLSATFVAVAILGEPIGSAILALVFLHEDFARIQLLGFAVLLLGIIVAAQTERTKRSNAPAGEVIVVAD